MRLPDTSVFPLFPLFRGAACLDATDGHLCLSSFSTFQRCCLFGCGGRTPRSFRFFLFSGVHMATMGRPDTSAFPLFLLFSGASCLDAAAGHLGLSAFSPFQGCTWLRWGGRTPRFFSLSPLFRDATVATTNRLASSLAGLFLRS